ncbi:hypothetical protein KR222_007729 [Zaprionus bogoriensis]|nr:hypothetical protein KR222_007729 [Zaprionus bogoriensis]
MPQERSRNIVDDVAEMQKSLEMLVQHAETTVDELSRTTAASAVEFRESLAEVIRELHQIDAENRTLQEDIDSFDNRNVQALQVLLSGLKKYDCSVELQCDRRDKRTLYRFDFGGNNYLTIKVENAKLALVEMSPTSKNFVEIKAHLDATQDFMGLLTSFRNKVFAMH